MPNTTVILKVYSKSAKYFPSLIDFFKLQFMQQYVRGHLPVSFNDVWIRMDARRQADNVEYLLQNSENFYTPISRLFSLYNHPYFAFPKIWDNFKEEQIKILREKSKKSVQH